MAVGLHSTLSGLMTRPADVTHRRKSVDMKPVALAALATAGTGTTPRKFVKSLHQVIMGLNKHKATLGVELLKALKDMTDLVNEAAHSCSSAATGKIHYYLTEDSQLRHLHAAAAALCAEVSSLAKLSTYAAPDFQVDIADAANKLNSCRCSLQARQLQLIEEFRNVASTVDPGAEDISDAAQKIAEQVVQKVIAEVHGPFFNDEILERELSHLEKVAARTNQDTHRYEAACIKLLAATLMELDAAAAADADADADSAESLLQDPESSGSADPFSVPSFTSAKISAAGPQPPAAQGGTATAAAAAAASGQLCREQGPPQGNNSKWLTAGATASSSAQQQHQQRLQERISDTVSQEQQQQPYGSSLDYKLQGVSESVAGRMTAGSAAAGQGSQQMLQEFIDSNTALGGSDSRRACTFHAEMRLPPDGVEKLATFLESTGRIRGLNLAHNWIGPQGMQRLCAAMCANKSVRSLDLPDNRLGDEGAACIAELLLSGSKVTSLQLSHNDIGDKGMCLLAEAISQTRILEKLSIYSNSITSVGCAALTAAVVANPNLKYVEFLPGNAAHSKDTRALARAVKQNRKFKIFHLFGKQNMPVIAGRPMYAPDRCNRSIDKQ